MKISSIALVLAVFLGPGLTCGGAAAAGKDDESLCGKKVSAQGMPSPIQSIANLNAVQLWIELAAEQSGADSAMWHNAAGGQVKCEQIERSAMYRCYATGKPCPPKPASTAAKPN